MSQEKKKKQRESSCSGGLVDLRLCSKPLSIGPAAHPENNASLFMHMQASEKSGLVGEVLPRFRDASDLRAWSHPRMCRACIAAAGRCSKPSPFSAERCTWQRLSFALAPVGSRDIDCCQSWAGRQNLWLETAIRSWLAAASGNVSERGQSVRNTDAARSPPRPDRPARCKPHSTHGIYNMDACVARFGVGFGTRCRRFGSTPARRTQLT
jgi:hypothetical protein